MKKLLLFFTAALIILLIKINIIAQENKADSVWINWEFLIGNWEGNNSGDPGIGSGSFSFNIELHGNILMRKGHTVFPSQGNKPELIHDDIMIVFRDNSDIPNKAIYFDNEGHVLHYNIDYPEKNSSITLTSESSGSEPIMRLSYKMMDDKNLSIKFETASLNHPDAFKVHVEGTAVRKK